VDSPLKRSVGHLPMNVTRFSIFLFAALMVGCVKPPIITPASQAEAEKAIDHTKARQLSDSIADNLLKDDRPSLRNQMEKAARDYYNEASFGSTVDQMFAMYGKPLEAEYKMDEIGRKTGSGGYDKPMRKFWYAVRTPKNEKGSVYLTVEVVPDEGGLASSGFALVTFPLGVPPSLK
jgi:hypothetical protein